MSWNDGKHTKVNRVQLTFDDAIRSIEVEYEGTNLQSQRRGATVGTKSDGFTLSTDEYITDMSGDYYKTFFTGDVITALTFKTNKKTYGPYGNKTQNYFSVDAPKDNQIAGFLGTSGNALNSIDVHFAPIPHAGSIKPKPVDPETNSGAVSGGGSKSDGPRIVSSGGSKSDGPGIDLGGGSKSDGSGIDSDGRSKSEGPGNVSGDSSKSDGPRTHSGGGSKPDGPRTESGSGSKPDGPEADSGGGSKLDGPRTDSGGRTKPDGPGANSGGGSKPDGPETDSRGGSKSDGPGIDSGDGSKHDGPETDSGRGSKLDGPGKDSGGGSKPDGPRTDSGGRTKPDGPGANSGGGSKPDGTETDSGGGSESDGPGIDSGGGSKPDGRKTDSDGGSKLDGPRKDSGGGSKPDGPRTDSGGGLKPDGPETDLNGGSKPDGPRADSGGGSNSGSGSNGDSITQKLDAQGGKGDNQWDDGGDHDGVMKIHITVRRVIEQIRFDYTKNGQTKEGPAHGVKGGRSSISTIEISHPGEYLLSVKGWSDSSNKIVGIQFTTNTKTSDYYGFEKYPGEEGTDISLEVKDKKIVGFHGFAGTHLNSLGAYFAPLKPSKKLKAVGGDEGASWDDGVFDGVKKIQVGQNKDGICFVAIEYHKGSQKALGDGHGKKSLLGVDTFELTYPGEYITSVGVNYDKLHIEGRGVTLVTCLKFKTNKQESPPFGMDGGVYFEFKEEGHKIVGFHGKVGDWVHQIGVHVVPI